MACRPSPVAAVWIPSRQRSAAPIHLVLRSVARWLLPAIWNRFAQIHRFTCGGRNSTEPFNARGFEIVKEKINLPDRSCSALPVSPAMRVKRLSRLPPAPGKASGCGVFLLHSPVFSSSVPAFLFLSVSRPLVWKAGSGLFSVGWKRGNTNPPFFRILALKRLSRAR